MPVTAFCFLIGAVAISGLPPLNGFVSEWLTYQSLLAGFGATGGLTRILFPMAGSMLALTGALAAACFVKAFAITFLALPRGEESARRMKRLVDAGWHGLLDSCLHRPWLGRDVVPPGIRPDDGTSSDRALEPISITGEWACALRWCASRGHSLYRGHCRRACDVAGSRRSSGVDRGRNGSGVSEGRCGIAVYPASPADNEYTATGVLQSRCG